MQISVEDTSDISRTMTVQVPEEKIQAEIDLRLKKLARQIKIDGFRPGKAPARIIRQRFGQQVRQEVISDLIDSSFREAVQEHQLHLASEPQLTPKEMAEGKGLSYEVQFEVYPEIQLAAMEDLEIEKPVCEITEQDVDSVIERLREQKKTWKEVDRPAQSDDRLTITFESTLNDEPIGEGKTEHFEVELGSDNMIPGFEDKLSGAKEGDHLEFELTFPEDYHDETLAGKTVLFKVDVEKVEAGQVPELDDNFMREHGVESGNLEEFRREIKANMERQRQKALRERLQAKVFDRLYKHNPISAPEGLVKQEIQRVLAPLGDSLKQNPELLNQLPLDNIKENAKKRVALGLLLAHIIKTHDIKPDPERVRLTVEELAENYEDPQEVIDWYYNNQEQLSQIKDQVLEQMVVDWILERAKVTEGSISYEDLMKQQQQQVA